MLELGAGNLGWEGSFRLGEGGLAAKLGYTSLGSLRILVATSSSSPISARFDRFQVDLNSGKLLSSGVRVPIQDQPLQVLRLLLQAEGRVVTREQLRSALWPEDTFVDFEHGVNTAVKKLRQALEDSAERPKFVETLPRVGYRFVVPVEWVAESGGKSGLHRVVPITGPVAVPDMADRAEGGWVGRWRVGLVAAGVVLIAAMGGYLLRHRTPMQPAALTITPFTTFPGFEIAPSFSPDGNQIVFSWFGYEKEFQFDLYVKQVGQERVVQLTHHPATFLVPAWSPDGRFIAFMRQADPEGTGVFLISALGGAERKLADITTYGSWEPIALSWTPDGKWLAFARANPVASGVASAAEHFRIHLVNVETTEERVIPEPSADCVHTWQPAFSPDGKELASVCVLTGGTARLYVQTADGKRAREVPGATSSEGFAGIAWSSDSRSLLYTSDSRLWRVPLTGGKPEQQLYAQDVESVAVAPNGNRMAYAQVSHRNSIWRMELAGLAKAAGPATKIISSSRGDIGGHISPDQKYNAFQSWRSGSPEIWVCDRDGSNPVRLTSFGGAQVGAPSWSPDGRRIVFDLRSSGQVELYTVNVDGGPPRAFPTGTANASNPVWSADGSWIYFSTEGPEAIWKAPVGGGRAVRLTAEGDGRIWPQESGDGKRVFFYKSDGGHGQAWSASVEGGDEAPVAGMPVDVSWVPARTGLYFIGGAPRHFALNYYDFVSRQIRKVAELPSLFLAGGPNLSLDGSTLLFQGIEHSESDIVLVEGVR
jgi:Tol biopolymer transport system component/DNA-binding winged helix-turn-helix (wHTH) protein